MSTIEDFKNAPIGATASSTETNARYIKSSDRWLLFDGRGDWRVDEYDLESEGFMLDPTDPTTAREALDLAWNLAHEVKAGQVIPAGTRYLERRNSELREYIAFHDMNPKSGVREWVRTLDPIPDPEPDWLNAPAVLANDHRDRLVIFFPVADRDKYWQSAQTGIHYHWSYLTNVTPLYPKGH